MFRKQNLKLIIVAIICLLLLQLATEAAAADCDKHPIYCQIKKNSPKLNNKKAMILSNVIYKMHRKYHIPTRIFTAILRHESGYSLKAKGRQCILLEGKKVCGPSDFGISQIHINTVGRWKFDIDKLTNDLEYSVEAGAKILSDFMKRYEARDVHWWLRYNCGTRSTTKRDTCQIYKKLVERYL